MSVKNTMVSDLAQLVANCPYGSKERGVLYRLTHNLMQETRVMNTLAKGLADITDTLHEEFAQAALLAAIDFGDKYDRVKMQPRGADGRWVADRNSERFKRRQRKSNVYKRFGNVAAAKRSS